MGFLKPKAAKSSSGNTNNALVTSTYSPAMQTGNNATNFMAQLLGVSPGGVSSGANTVGGVANAVAEGGGAQAGYQNYLQQAGYAPAMQQMMRGITGQGAAQGLLRSGATGGAYVREGTNLNNSFFNNYMQLLQGLSNQGLQAGGLVTNAGQQSSSTGGGPSTAGAIASTVGKVASIFSDRRLKTDIEKVDELDDGLGIYAYRYLWNPTRIFGVMADEVAKLRPWALGPEVGGFATVNYEAL